MAWPADSTGKRMSLLNQRKAQAALEFLMTYGWAILIVLVVIGALAFFGVLSPSKLVPERCTFSAGISCVDYSVSDRITLKVENKLGRDMIIRAVTATSNALGTGNVCSTKPFPVLPVTSSDGCPALTGPPYSGCEGGATLNKGEAKNIWGSKGSGPGIVSDSNLVGLWLLDGDVNDLQTNDSGPYGYTGTFVGDAKHTTVGCRIGECVTFDGTGDYIDLGWNVPNLNFGASTDFTIEAWIKPASPGTTRYIAGKKANGGLASRGYILYIESSGIVTFRISDGTTQVDSYTAAGVVSDGNWHHVAAVANRGGTSSVYIDGNLASTTPSISAIGNIDDNNNVRFAVGSHATSNGGYSGLMDGVKVFRRALSPSEISGEAGSSCLQIDTGRNKNKYDLTVYYSWLDSPQLVHSSSGEMMVQKT